MAVINNVPFEACMKVGKGHLHLGSTGGGKVTDDAGNEIGEVYCDPAATVIVKVRGENYHINAIDLWKAVRDSLLEVQNGSGNEVQHGGK